MNEGKFNDECRTQMIDFVVAHDMMNGWRGDWWYNNPIQLGGRKWEISGCMYNGELELTLREDN